MHTVIDRAQLSPNVTRLVIEAPRIAEIRKPGQFVIVHRAPGAERIPLTIADADPGHGTITLVIQSVGKSTEDLVALQPGDAIADVAGPLGKATELLDHGRAVCVGGGVGTAVVYPIALGLAARGVEVISVIGGRSKEWVIFEDELRRAGEVITCTDDGSYGRHGFVTDALRDVIEAGGVDAVYAVGPVPMMRAVAEVTRPFGVPTFASLNASCSTGRGCAAAAASRSAARPSTPASTGPSSMPTRSTSGSLPTGWAPTGTSRRTHWRSRTDARPRNWRRRSTRRRAVA